MRIVATIKALISLLLFLAVGLGGYAWWVWGQRDVLLHATITEKLPEIAPGWNIRFGRVHFDWYRRVRIHDVSILAGASKQSFVAVPDLVITIDRQLFAQQQQIAIQKVKAVSPTIELTRSADGHWTWEGLPPIRSNGRPSPELEISEGTIRIRFERPDNAPATTVTLRQIDLRLIPSGRRAYIVKGATHVNQSASVGFSGKFDLDAKSWSLDGKVGGVATNGDLLALAAGISPEFRANLVKLDDALTRIEAATAAPAPSPIAPIAPIASPGDSTFAVSASTEPPTASALLETPRESPDRLPDFGVAGTMDIGFHVDQPQPDAPPTFTLDVGLRQGQVNHRALPFPLHDLEADVHWDNGQIDIRRLSARNGNTRFEFGGKLERVEGIAPGEFGLRIESLPLDERLQKRLPPALRRVYDSLQPSGTIDAACLLSYDGRGKWKPHDAILTARGCQVVHVKFPYVVTDVSGTITQDGDTLDMLFEGRAGRQSVLCEGVVRKPGPEAEALFDVAVRQLPLDDTLVAACPASVQQTVRNLNVRGVADAAVRIYRPPGPARRFELTIGGDLSRGSLEYVHFPYRLTNLAGRLDYASVGETWTFSNLTAEHGHARLAGSGSFVKAEPPGRLDLHIAAADAPLDQQLQLALPNKLRKVWDDLAVAGTLKNLQVDIAWVPGKPARIDLPEIEVTGGSLDLKEFPYAMTAAAGRFAWSDGLLTIHDFSAAHDDALFRGKGFVEVGPDDSWRLRFDEAQVDDLIPDRAFRRALPAKLRAAVDAFDPQGPISVSGMFELYGSSLPDDPITSAWDVQTTLAGGSLNAGVVLKAMHGGIACRGRWDGAIVDLAGSVDLDSLMALDHQFTQVKGPFRLHDTQLVVGSADVMVPDRRPRDARPIPIEERITARAIDGIITLDAAVSLLETTAYHVKMTLNKGRVEEYAARYLPGTRNLRGVMTGWIDLQGRGTSASGLTGRGRLTISPAALYELPVFVQMFRVMSFTPPDKTAFHYAYTEFRIEREHFLFSVIDLVGDAINLRGHGSAGFDGRLNIDFYSTMPKNGLAKIPVINFVVGEATKGWVGVEVRGQISQPAARVKAVPQLDEAMKRFLGAFDPRQAAPFIPLPGFGGY